MARPVLLRADDGFNLPRLNVEEGSSYGWDDLWFTGLTRDGKGLVDMSDWQARDMETMLDKDYKARQIESVLTLPILSATTSIRPAAGDKGEAKWLEQYWETDEFSGGPRTSLQQIIARMTSAFSYRRAYMEKVWTKGTGPFAGKIVYHDLAWRPQTTCRLIRDRLNGRFMGFEQEAYFVGQGIDPNKWPIQIPPNRSFVYTHGTRRDPLNGSSDLEVAFWCYQTKQKILLLWLQFLQAVSLPRVIVKAGDQETATQVAQQIARLKSSGVLPVSSPAGPESITIDSLDLSGKGAEQFASAIDWLDTAAADSVLAGFLNLTGRVNMSHFGGSYALSKDASDFFLQSEEAKTREIEDQVRRGIFAPLIRYNFGKNAAIPLLKFEPLNDIDKETAVALLKQAMAAPPGGPVPTAFIAGLAEQVSTSLGLDGSTMHDEFKKSFDAAAAQAAAKGLAEHAQGVAGMAGATASATQAMRTGGASVKKHTARAVAAKTGGAISLSHFDPAEPRDPHTGKWTFKHLLTKSGGDYESHKIVAVDPEGEARGVLGWSNHGVNAGRVNSLWVEPDYRRQGIGTQLYEHAKVVSPDIEHSVERSDAGDAFVRSVDPHAAKRRKRESTKDADDIGRQALTIAKAQMSGSSVFVPAKITDLSHFDPSEPRDPHSGKWIRKGLPSGDIPFPGMEGLVPKPKPLDSMPSNVHLADTVNLTNVDMKERHDEVHRMLSDPEVAAAYLQGSQDMLHNVDQSRVHIGMLSYHLDQVLADGGFKNGWETGGESTFGPGYYGSDYDDPDASGYWANRYRYEKKDMGVSEGDGPIYGWVGGHVDAVQEYGNMSWVLKKRVDGRSTVTFGDSLNGMIKPTPKATVLGLSAQDLADSTDDYDFADIETIHRQITESRQYDLPGLEPRNQPPHDYIEAQVHGGITLDDVDAVSMPQKAWDRLSPEQQGIFARKGIAVNLT